VGVAWFLCRRLLLDIVIVNFPRLWLCQPILRNTTWKLPRQNKGHFAVQGHSRSPFLYQSKASSYTASYIMTIARQLLCIKSCIYEPARNLYRGRRAVPLQTFTTRHSNRKLSIVMALSTTFTQCAPESNKFGKITQNKSHFAIQVIPGHRFCYQSKAHIRLSIKTISRQVLRIKSSIYESATEFPPCSYRIYLPWASRGPSADVYN